MLGAQGLAAGAYLSPHVHGLRGARAARRRAARRGPAGGGRRARRRRRRRRWSARPASRLTQFEALTAAAFVALGRAAGAEVVVVEAGLGGRYDATNVLAAPRRRADQRRARPHRPARRRAEAIAGEKLAVVHPGARWSWRRARTRSSRAICARAGAAAGAPGAAARGRAHVRTPARWLARAERRSRTWRSRSRARAGVPGSRAARSRPPRSGRPRRSACRAGWSSSDGDPPMVLDGAHNPRGDAPAGGRARPPARRAPAPVARGRRPAHEGVDEMLWVLAPHVDAVVATSSGIAAALDPDARAGRVAAAGLEPQPGGRPTTPPAARRRAPARRGGAGDGVAVPARPRARGG